MSEPQPRRRRRRAVGPPGAVPAGEAPPGLLEGPESTASPEDVRAEDARLRADRPPHHDRGV